MKTGDWVGLGALGIVLVFVLTLVHGWPTGEATASWLSAIGTIAAAFAAVWLGLRKAKWRRHDGLVNAAITGAAHLPRLVTMETCIREARVAVNLISSGTLSPEEACKRTIAELGTVESLFDLSDFAALYLAVPEASLELSEALQMASSMKISAQKFQLIFQNQGLAASHRDLFIKRFQEISFHLETVEQSLGRAHPRLKKFVREDAVGCIRG